MNGHRAVVAEQDLARPGFLARELIDEIPVVMQRLSTRRR
jgi:hypothetical protein